MPKFKHVQYLTYSTKNAMVLPILKHYTIIGRGIGVMTRQLVFKSHYRGNSGTIAARRMLRHYTEDKGHHWAYGLHSVAWEYGKSIDENHEFAVRMACRLSEQKDPVSIAYGGEDTDGLLWIVTITE